MLAAQQPAFGLILDKIFISHIISSILKLKGVNMNDSLKENKTPQQDNTNQKLDANTMSQVFALINPQGILQELDVKSNDATSTHIQGIAKHGNHIFVSSSVGTGSLEMMQIDGSSSISVDVYNGLEGQRSHFGGFQTIGHNILVGCEDSKGSDIQLFPFNSGGLNDPIEIKNLSSNTRKAGSVGIANVRFPDEDEDCYVAAICHSDEEIYFYYSEPGVSLNADTEFKCVSWNSKYANRSGWSPDSNWSGYVNAISLVTEQGENGDNLYFIGMREDSSGRDQIDLFTVNISALQQDFSADLLKRIDNLHAYAHDGVHFRWGASVSVIQLPSSDNTMQFGMELIATEKNSREPNKTHGNIFNSMSLEEYCNLTADNIAKGDCKERLNDMEDAVKLIRPDIKWQLIVSHTSGYDNWTFSLHNSDLYIKTGWHHGYCYVVFNSGANANISPQLFDETIANSIANITAQAGCKDKCVTFMSQLNALNNSAFWCTLIKRSPGGFDNWAYLRRSDESIYYKEWIDDYCYVAWGK
jgi:hypothetical protein